MTQTPLVLRNLERASFHIAQAQEKYWLIKEIGVRWQKELKGEWHLFQQITNKVEQ